MNQNNQQDSIFMSLPVTKNAKYYRTVALQKLKPFWLTAILVAFLAALLGGVGAGLSINFNFNFADTSDTLLTEAELAQIEAWVANGEINAAIEEIIAKNPTLTFFLNIFVWVAIITVVISIAIVLFIASPLKVGYQRFHLEIHDGNEKEVRVGTLFRFFKEIYFKTIGLNVLHTLIMLAAWIPTAIMGAVGVSFMITQIPLVTSLWEVLVGIGIGMAFIALGAIVTAIIEIPLSYMYGFAYMIMADHPNISPLDALRSSRTLMKGHKWRLFCLDFSFFGWYFLGMLCFGIGILAVYPYHYTARAAFYHDITGRETAGETEFPSLDPNDYKID